LLRLLKDWCPLLKKNALAEVQSAEDMMTETKAAQEDTDNAAIQLRNADAAENSAQVYSTSVRKELEYRVQQLVELNRPGILEPGDWSLPKNVSPSEIKVYTRRSDGKTQLIYGNERDQSGEVTGEHGHTVIDKNADIDYTRTQKGTILKNTKK
jgi:hypothetical protein